MNRRIDPETAVVQRVEGQHFTIRTRNFEPGHVSHVYLSYSQDGIPYFMAAPLEAHLGDRLLRLRHPPVIFRAERRSRIRRTPEESTRFVSLRVDDRGLQTCEVLDWSPEGIAIAVPSEVAETIGSHAEVRAEWSGDGRPLYADVCYRASDREGWTRLGLDVSAAPRTDGLRIERRSSLAASGLLRRTERRWKVLSAGLRIASERALVSTGLRQRKTVGIPLVEYKNADGETIRAIVDAYGDTRTAPAVVMPPAWGKTKETLWPLAACILAAFRGADEPVVVVRFDGIRKKGESHNEVECFYPGREHHRFTFSQGVRDIRATVDYLSNSEEFRPRGIFLVSFSAASIESRRAVAEDGRIHGWISVVGSADLQSMMRVISGGIDYGAGFERGIRFGVQEILGIEVDMDHAGLDAIQNNLAFLENARRDFANIQQPVTWIHGRYDAWMDPIRVQDVMSRGDASRRKLIEVPTGHMLKTSREALETFQLVVRELSAMALGREIEPVLPKLSEIERRMQSERRRLRKAEPDLKAFWRDYLLGKDRSIGIELMTSISPYDELMSRQVEALHLVPGARIADIGAGTGALPRYLGNSPRSPSGLRVIELDFIREAFQRTRERFGGFGGRLQTDFVECDLGTRKRGAPIPLASGSVDAVLASLFLSYVAEPQLALAEMRRVLRPRGHVVVSSLRRDADMSKLYAEGLAELRGGRARAALGEEAEARLEEAGRAYLNQASRLLGLEDEGVFRFWDPRELENLLRCAGFTELRSIRCFGDPPQAVVVSGRRP